MGRDACGSSTRAEAKCAAYRSARPRAQGGHGGTVVSVGAGPAPAAWRHLPARRAGEAEARTGASTSAALSADESRLLADRATVRLSPEGLRILCEVSPAAAEAAHCGTSPNPAGGFSPQYGSSATATRQLLSLGAEVARPPDRSRQGWSGRIGAAAQCTQEAAARSGYTFPRPRVPEQRQPSGYPYAQCRGAGIVDDLGERASTSRPRRITTCSCCCSIRKMAAEEVRPVDANEHLGAGAATPVARRARALPHAHGLRHAAHEEECRSDDEIDEDRVTSTNRLRARRAPQERRSGARRTSSRRRRRRQAHPEGRGGWAKPR